MQWWFPSIFCHGRDFRAFIVAEFQAPEVFPLLIRDWPWFLIGFAVRSYKMLIGGRLLLS